MKKAKGINLRGKVVDELYRKADLVLEKIDKERYISKKDREYFNFVLYNSNHIDILFENQNKKILILNKEYEVLDKNFDIKSDISKRFPNDFTTFDLDDNGIHNVNMINKFISEVMLDDNDTEMIIRNGVLVFKKGENVFVVTSDQLFASTED